MSKKNTLNLLDGKLNPVNINILEEFNFGSLDGERDEILKDCFVLTKEINDLLKYKYNFKNLFFDYFQLPPDKMISTSPDIKRRNISVNSTFVCLDDPLNSFQINTPQIAATIVAPCPSP